MKWPFVVVPLLFIAHSIVFAGDKATLSRPNVLFLLTDDQRWDPRDDKPWCLMIGHKAPHSFYFPEPKYAQAFDDVRVPYPETAFMLDDKPTWIKQRLYTWHGIYGPLFEWRKKFPDDSPAAVKC